MNLTESEQMIISYVLEVLQSREDCYELDQCGYLEEFWRGNIEEINMLREKLKAAQKT